MKRLVSFVAMLACILVSTGFAEGKLSVSQKNLHIFDGDDNGYFYAKIENTGDETIAVGTGTLVAFTAEDEIAFSEDYISVIPGRVELAPGEYVYAKEYIWDSALQDNTIGDYKFSIESNARGNVYKKEQCEAHFDLPGADSYDNYVYVTFTNTTDELIYGYCIAVALTDAEGNLLFVDGDTIDALAVYPGSTISVRVYVDQDLMSYYKAHDLKPSNVDAMVYYPVE